MRQELEQGLTTSFGVPASKREELLYQVDQCQLEYATLRPDLDLPRLVAEIRRLKLQQQHLLYATIIPNRDGSAEPTDGTGPGLDGRPNTPR